MAKDKIKLLVAIKCMLFCTCCFNLCLSLSCFYSAFLSE